MKLPTNLPKLIAPFTNIKDKDFTNFKNNRASNLCRHSQNKCNKGTILGKF